MITLDQGGGSRGIDKQSNYAYVLKTALKEFAFRWIWGMHEGK